MNYPALGHPVRPLALLLTLAMTSLLAAPLSAADLSLTLRDEDGSPVTLAVVEARITPAEAQPDAPVAEIDQVERRFVPMVLLVPPGQLVNFPNSDNVRHHVYSFSDIKQFSTPLYADENVEPVRFDTPGIAVLGCNIHDSMVAYVYVSAWRDTALSNDRGDVTLASMAELPETLHIWHPWLQTPDNVYELDLSAYSPGDHIELTLPVVNPDQQFGFRALLPGGTQ